MSERRIESGLCTHCKIDRVVLIDGDEPWTDDHWSCPSCHSTYCLEQYKIPEDPNRFILTELENCGKYCPNFKVLSFEIDKCIITAKNINKNDFKYRKFPKWCPLPTKKDMSVRG